MIDSRLETHKHIQTVQRILALAIADLVQRGPEHDSTKLKSPEVELFDEFTPLLAATTYGTDEYRALLAKIKPALDHHYAAHRHHPEHFPDGIQGMNLMDLLEMICDWMAVAKRHADGDVVRSIEVGKKRFGYSEDLYWILLNTVAALDAAQAEAPHA
jgi:hypothetical protein